MTEAFINRIATAVPPNDVHAKFVSFAPTLLSDDRARRLFRRMADRAGIEHRFSVLKPAPDAERVDDGGLFARGAFPDTAIRMDLYERHAPVLAEAAARGLGEGWQAGVTHLIVTTCTGLFAPGLDLRMIAALGLNPGVERTVVGFMGCQAALNALKLARHIVRSDPASRVLVVNLELCTLHLKETEDLEELLSFLIFADGAAASLISAEPRGLEMTRFKSGVVPESEDLITWRIGRQAFDMHLSGHVPGAILRGLPAVLRDLLGNHGIGEVDSWAVHPGGRTVLDAVEQAAELPPEALSASREVLQRYGNMSSPSVMFVLAEAMRRPARLGCALAFGPGVTAEAMLFRSAEAGHA